MRRELDEVESALGRHAFLSNRALHQLDGRLGKIESLLGRIVESWSDPPSTSHRAEVLQDRLDGIQAALYDLALLSAEEAPSSGAQPSGPESPRSVYAASIRAVREVVRREVPREARLLVISRGDDTLLNLYGRQAWHFPRGEDGFFLGEYPADSADAVEQLERWRSAGANFLVIPRSSFWWLEYYGEFSDHLSRNYSNRVADENVLLFDLGAASGGLGIQRALPTDLAMEVPDVVSVIFPLHNAYLPRVGSRWFHQTVESVLSQQGVAIELLIINDGSLDETSTALRHYDPWSTVNVLELQKSRGFSAAMNLGICATSGAFISCITLGDLFCQDKLVTQLSLLRERDLSLVGAGAVVAAEDGGEEATVLPPVEHADIVTRLAQTLPFLPGTVFFKREVWEATGGFSSAPGVRFAEMLDFVQRAALFPGIRIGAVREPLLTYRPHTGRASLSPLTAPLHRVTAAACAALFEGAERWP